MTAHPRHRNHQAPHAPRWTMRTGVHSNERLLALRRRFRVDSGVREKYPDPAVEQRPLLQEKLEEWLQTYRRDGVPAQSALIPLLQQSQSFLGYLPRWALEDIAERLRIPYSTVYGVTTFYAQFRLQPQGRNVIKVCMGTACHVRGGATILEAVREQLGIGPGETTADLEFSMERVACLGACGLAPVVVVNDEAYGRMDPDGVQTLLQGLRNNGSGEA